MSSVKATWFPDINFIYLWCIILLMYFCIKFANILLRIFPGSYTMFFFACYFLVL